MRADALRNRARILAAAEEVFVERGPAASTEEVAARAGVAIGTVFRHFPTKQELLQALVKELLARLTAEADALVAEGDPATALFTFFTHLVEQAAAKQTVIELLARSGVDVGVEAALQTFRDAVTTLLARAQQTRAVRDDIALDEVMALLTAVSRGALDGGWDPALQDRTLAVVFNGLRPAL